MKDGTVNQVIRLREEVDDVIRDFLYRPPMTDGLIKQVRGLLGLPPIQSDLDWVERDSIIETTLRLWIGIAPETPAFLFLRSLRALGAAAGDAIVPSDCTPEELAAGCWRACQQQDEGSDLIQSNRPVSDGLSVTYKTRSGGIALTYSAGQEVTISVIPYPEDPEAADAEAEVASIWNEREKAAGLVRSMANAMELADRALYEGLGAPYQESHRLAEIRRLAEVLGA